MEDERSPHGGHVFNESVNWADIDAFGHVNNLAYLRYFQSARIALCQSVGIAVQPEEEQPSFIVASTQCEYHNPLLFPESISVRTTVTHLGETSIGLQHLLFDSKNHRCATGLDVLVLYDYASKEKVNMSEQLRAALLRWKD